MIDTLADYFTGAVVAHNSMLLEAGGMHRKMAQKFFECRSLLGISGYMTRDEAIIRISAALKAMENKRATG